MKITQASYPLAKRSSAISSHTSHYFLRPLTGRNLAPGNKERKKERKEEFLKKCHMYQLKTFLL